MAAPNTLGFRKAVAAATTANLVGTFTPGPTAFTTKLTGSTPGALVVDTYTGLLNDRILVKNQTAGLQNGLYILTTVGSAASGNGPIATVGTLVAGSGYVSGTYNNIPFIGGTGKNGTAVITVAGPGPINSFGASTAGTLYTNGQFVNVALTGGTGSGAMATIIVQGGGVYNVRLTNPGTGYAVNDVLSASLAGGSGFTITVASVLAGVSSVSVVTGSILMLGTVTGGSGYTAGTYNNVPLTGGSGTGAQATVVVTGGSGPPVINLASAVTYGVGASTTITASTPSVVNGNVFLSPAGSITGTITVSGTTNNGNAAASTALTDANNAFTQGNALTPYVTIAAELGGTSPAPGYYTTGSSFQITGTVTLNGTANSVWVFKSPSSTLTTAASSVVLLTGGAQASNVYWLVGSSATLGTSSTFKGTIIASASITDNGGSTVTGHMLALTGAVTLNNTTVTATAAGSPTATTGPVTSATITAGGSGYLVGDVLSALAANIGGTGSGFSVPVLALSSSSNPGTGYTVGDVLTVNAAFLGGQAGVGFSIDVATVVPSNWVLTRSIDSADAGTIPGFATFVGNGSQVGTAWVETSAPVIVDTTPWVFVEFIP